MERTNVTLSLPTPLVQKARHYAVDHATSLSAVVCALLEERVAAPLDSYAEVSRRAIDRLNRRYPLGPMQPWSRDETHER